MAIPTHTPGGVGDNTSNSNVIGMALAISSSAFIGASFIVKKKGLHSSNGTRAGSGGHAYLLNPLWWAGMVTMIVGEIANFTAYTFAPAILVTPMGALSVVVSAILASLLLKETLHVFGKVGCFLCIIGSTQIVLNAPQEKEITSVEEIWGNALQPGFIVYVVLVLLCTAVLVFYMAPRYGRSNVLVYLLICSLIGSLSVMAVKGLGIALKLTFEGNNQLKSPITWAFVVVVVACIVTQMNYLNKALDIFNTAVVTPIYYVFFTSFTIIASIILFRDYHGESGKDIVGGLCGFLTIVSGVFFLHAAKNSGAADPMRGRSLSVQSLTRGGSLDGSSRDLRMDGDEGDAVEIGGERDNFLSQ